MIDIATLHEALQAAGTQVVGVAYYPDPELRHAHVPAGPVWWYVAEDYAIRVDTLAPLSVEEESVSSVVISEWWARGR